jgi:hypothetical protein
MTIPILTLKEYAEVLYYPIPTYLNNIAVIGRGNPNSDYRLADAYFGYPHARVLIKQKMPGTIGDKYVRHVEDNNLIVDAPKLQELFQEYLVTNNIKFENSKTYAIQVRVGDKSSSISDSGMDKLVVDILNSGMTNISICAAYFHFNERVEYQPQLLVSSVALLTKLYTRLVDTKLPIKFVSTQSADHDLAYFVTAKTAAYLCSSGFAAVMARLRNERTPKVFGEHGHLRILQQSDSKNNREIGTTNLPLKYTNWPYKQGRCLYVATQELLNSEQCVELGNILAKLLTKDGVGTFFITNKTDCFKKLNLTDEKCNILISTSDAAHELARLNLVFNVNVLTTKSRFVRYGILKVAVMDAVEFNRYNSYPEKIDYIRSVLSQLYPVEFINT